jgi:membrane fusion protein, multidrug efflux system
MRDTVSTPAPDTTAPPGSRLSAATGFLRARLRMILLVVVPLVALAAGVAFYLGGGRYISTDNAYVGAQKVLITPDVSGKIERVAVREGQHVAAGDELLRIDPQPFKFALAQAEAKLAAVRIDFAKLKTDYRSLLGLTDLAIKSVDLKRHDVERKSTLLESRAGSPADLDTAMAALVTVQLQAQYAAQQRDDILNQLCGDADLPIDKFPAYIQAEAALEQAQRDLAHTTLLAPIGGTATQVDNIQLGRFIAAGTPLMSVIDDTAPWIDANPKETDITWLAVGQQVEIDVDTFPDHTFRGIVAAVSPGTGAQFSILPPQNASGNWVKVVQRVPVRIAFDKDEDTTRLRSGMSVTVEIDTRRSRSLATLFGLSSVAQERRDERTNPRRDNRPGERLP